MIHIFIDYRFSIRRGYNVFMALNIQTVINKVIFEVIEEFNIHPDIFLTEEDVRCHIVSRLLQYKELSELTDTIDGSKSIPIHTEVRWYGTSGLLRYRSDIVLLKPNSLKTKKSFHLPTKGYSFDKFDSIIEVKLRRIRPRSDKKYLQLINNDFTRLQALIKEVEGVNASFHLLCFDKRSDLGSHLKEYNQDRKINFRYIYKNCE